MGWFKREKRAEQDEGEVMVDSALLSSMLFTEKVNEDTAGAIPTFKSCINFISDQIALLPIKLYSENGRQTEEIVDDKRIFLLNDDPGGMMDGYQMKKALVSDYLISGKGYIYIKRHLNRVESLHFIPSKDVGILRNSDIITPYAEYQIGGKRYQNYEFIRILLNSSDGIDSRGIVDENNELLSLAFSRMRFESKLLSAGGSKKGFLQSARKLTEPAMDKLKEAWRALYSNNENNMMILNDGLKFTESSNSLAEMQLNENKKTDEEQICSLFGLSLSVVKGGGTEKEFDASIKTGVMPHIEAIQAALNKALLLENEKKTMYFAFDTSEMLKGSLLDRYRAYSIALRDNFMQLDEVRYKENLNPLGFNYMKLGLQDVLLDPKTKEVYTPNTNAKVNLSDSQIKDEPINNLVGDGTVATAQEAVSSAEETVGKALNGAQTQSLLAVMKSLSEGGLSEGQAIAIISTAIGVSKSDAAAIIKGE